MYRIQVNVHPTVSRLNRAKAGIMNRRRLFTQIRKEWLIRNIKEIFATDGNGKWKATTRTNPILRDTRRMYKSYTRANARGNVNRIRGDTLTWGSSIEYSDYHETGTSRMVARPVIGMLAQQKYQRRLSNIVDTYMQGIFRRTTNVG